MIASGQSRQGSNQQQVQPCPLFADRYRSGEPLNLSFRAKNCREHSQQNGQLFDHLVGDREQRRRDSETERRGRLQIDHKVEPYRLLDG